MNRKLPVLVLLVLTQVLVATAQSPAQLKALRKALEENKSKENNGTTTEAPPPPEPTTRDPRLTGDPRHDYIYDPNLPRELNGYNLSDYPFYTVIPDDITFKCDGRLDGYYASIPHRCQLFHLCAHSLRHDFLCANYTVFDQSQFICHFVNSVNCAKSEIYYERNNELYVTTTTTEPPLYDDEYEDEAPRTKRPARRRKGGRGRRRKGRRRTTTTAAPDDYYYDDYEEPLEEEVAEETTAEPKTTAAPAPPEEPLAPPKPSGPKIRRPQLRPQKPLTQPPTAPPVEEEPLYDYVQPDAVGEEPAATEEFPIEEVPEEVAKPRQPTRGQVPRVPEGIQESVPAEEEHRRPAAPRPQARPVARRPAQTAPLHQEAPPNDAPEVLPLRRQAGTPEEASGSGAAAGTLRRQRVSAVDRPRRTHVAAQEAPSEDISPEHPAGQVPQRPQRRPILTEAAVAPPAEEEGPSIARSVFRGAARPSEDLAAAAAVPGHRQEVFGQPHRPTAGSSDEGTLAEELPQRPVLRRTGAAPKARQPAARDPQPLSIEHQPLSREHQPLSRDPQPLSREHQPKARQPQPQSREHQPLSREPQEVLSDSPVNGQAPRQSPRRGPQARQPPVGAARESHPPGEPQEVIVDRPVSDDQEPRQSLRRGPPRRRLQRDLPASAPGYSYQPFQGTSDLGELEAASSKQSSTALLPDRQTVINGILSGIGPILPKDPEPKNKTGNETEAETQRPEPPTSDSFVVGSILSGIGTAPAKGPAVEGPRVTGKPKAKKPEVSRGASAAEPEAGKGEAPAEPEVGKDEAPAEPEVGLASSRSTQQTKAVAPTAQTPASKDKDNDKRLVVKRRRKPTTTKAPTTPEQEYEYVE